MSIYKDPLSFSKKVRMPLRLAEIWCTHQLKLQEEMDLAKICPKCGKPTLTIESGSYEENTRDYVYCENDEIAAFDEEEGDYFIECDYVTSPEKGHEALSYWYDFDVLWAYAVGFVDKGQFDSLQEWLTYVREEVAKIEPKLSA